MRRAATELGTVPWILPCGARRSPAARAARAASARRRTTSPPRGRRGSDRARVRHIEWPLLPPAPSIDRSAASIDHERTQHASTSRSYETAAEMCGSGPRSAAVKVPNVRDVRAPVSAGTAGGRSGSRAVVATTKRGVSGSVGDRLHGIARQQELRKEQKRHIRCAGCSGQSPYTARQVAVRPAVL